MTRNGENVLKSVNWLVLCYVFLYCFQREVGTSGTIDLNTALDMCRNSMNNKCGKVIDETETVMIANNTYTIVACAYDKMVTNMLRSLYYC